MDGTQGRWWRQKRFTWGVFMIALGTMFLLLQYDLLPFELGSGWWTLFVIGAGVAGLFSADSPRRFGSAVTTIGIGVWLAASVGHWYGLRWSSSWPLVLVAIGIGSLAEWAASLWMARRGEEDDHVG